MGFLYENEILTWYPAFYPFIVRINACWIDVNESFKMLFIFREKLILDLLNFQASVDGGFDGKSLRLLND